MLKWLLGLLLVANLAFVAYMQWGGAVTDDSAVAQSQPPLYAEKIKLLKTPPATAAASQVTAPVGAAAAPPVAAASAVAAGAAPTAVAPAAVAPVAGAPVGARAGVCMEWGEFSGTDLARATDALAALKLGDRLAQHQSEHNAGYWVYLPPQASHADVEKKVAELKALGITDYFVVNDTKQWLNAISLGIFKTEDAARKFLDNMKAKGVRRAAMGERFSKLRFTVFDLHNLDPASAGKITVLQKQFADSDLKVIPCSR